MKRIGAALAYDGVAYALTPTTDSSEFTLTTLFKALDPFQNAEQEWRRSLNYLAREWDTQSGRFL